MDAVIATEILDLNPKDSMQSLNTNQVHTPLTHNILVTGYVGAGVSSTINSLVTAVQPPTKSIVKNLTKQQPISAEKKNQGNRCTQNLTRLNVQPYLPNLKAAFWETWGVSANGQGNNYDTIELDLLLQGMIPDRFQMPKDSKAFQQVISQFKKADHQNTIHAAAVIVPQNLIMNPSGPELTTIKSFIGKLKERGRKPLIIISKLDQLLMDMETDKIQSLDELTVYSRLRRSAANVLEMPLEDITCLINYNSPKLEKEAKRNQPVDKQCIEIVKNLLRRCLDFQAIDPSMKVKSNLSKQASVSSINSTSAPSDLKKALPPEPTPATTSASVIGTPRSTGLAVNALFLQVQQEAKIAMQVENNAHLSPMASPEPTVKSIVEPEKKGESKLGVIPPAVASDPNESGSTMEVIDLSPPQPRTSIQASKVVLDDVRQNSLRVDELPSVALKLEKSPLPSRRQSEKIETVLIKSENQTLPPTNGSAPVQPESSNAEQPTELVPVKAEIPSKEPAKESAINKEKMDIIQKNITDAVVQKEIGAENEVESTSVQIQDTPQADKFLDKQIVGQKNPIQEEIQSKKRPDSSKSSKKATKNGSISTPQSKGHNRGTSKTSVKLQSSEQMNSPVEIPLKNQEPSPQVENVDENSKVVETKSEIKNPVKDNETQLANNDGNMNQQDTISFNTNQATSEKNVVNDNAEGGILKDNETKTKSQTGWREDISIKVLPSAESHDDSQKPVTSVEERPQTQSDTLKKDEIPLPTTKFHSRRESSNKDHASLIAKAIAKTAFVKPISETRNEIIHAAPQDNEVEKHELSSANQPAKDVDPSKPAEETVSNQLHKNSEKTSTDEMLSESKIQIQDSANVSILADETPVKESSIHAENDRGTHVKANSIKESKKGFLSKFRSASKEKIDIDSKTGNTARQNTEPKSETSRDHGEKNCVSTDPAISQENPQKEKEKSIASKSSTTVDQVSQWKTQAQETSQPQKQSIDLNLPDLTHLATKTELSHVQSQISDIDRHTKQLLFKIATVESAHSKYNSEIDKLNKSLTQESHRFESDVKSLKASISSLQDSLKNSCVEQKSELSTAEQALNATLIKKIDEVNQTFAALKKQFNEFELRLVTLAEGQNLKHGEKEQEIDNKILDLQKTLIQFKNDLLNRGSNQEQEMKDLIFSTIQAKLDVKLADVMAQQQREKRLEAEQVEQRINSIIEQISQLQLKQTEIKKEICDVADLRKHDQPSQPSPQPQPQPQPATANIDLKNEPLIIQLQENNNSLKIQIQELQSRLNEISKTTTEALKTSEESKERSKNAEQMASKCHCTIL